jgi:hypothetical protein
MTETKYNLMDWQAKGLCNASAQVKLTGYDNGDGDGPHWFDLEINTIGAGDFSSTTNITINSSEELKRLADYFTRAYYQAQDIKNATPSNNH